MHTGAIRVYRQRSADHARLAELIPAYAHEPAGVAAELGRFDARDTIMAGVPVDVGDVDVVYNPAVESATPVAPSVPVAPPWIERLARPTRDPTYITESESEP